MLPVVPHRLPDVNCSYPRRNPYKVWVNVGGIKRIFSIGTLENLIHYGLDCQATTYCSVADEVPDGPGILPRTLRMGMTDAFPKLHHRGFLVFHQDALKWRPTRGEITGASMAHWYQSVLRHGAWKLSPEAKHILRGAKEWLKPQPVFALDGGIPIYSLTSVRDEALHPKLSDETITAILATVESFGAKGKVINNRDPNNQPPIMAPSLVGPHLLMSAVAEPGAYWLKQGTRAEDHILGAVWKILEPPLTDCSEPTRRTTLVER